LSEFQIAETKGFTKRKESIAPELYEKIRDVVYPQLRKNPYFGPNIKKLKGKLAPYYRFRIGDYRLFYLIEADKVLVAVVDLKHRQGAYK
jgi:mRNA interferase RelE/StbE